MQRSFLFYDQLRQSALMRFSDDSKQDVHVLADIFLAIHQCERHTYRYMAHVVQDIKQQEGVTQHECKQSVCCV